VGCGCNKNRTSRSARIKKISTKLRTIKKPLNKKSPFFPINKRYNICISCPYSSQTKTEKKRGLRVCHRINRLINNIIKDTKFKCPAGKFDKIK